MATNYNTAFFIAPLLVPLTAVISMASIFGFHSSVFGSEESIAIFLFIIGVPVTYVFVMLFGMPVYLWLKNKNNLSLSSLFIAGFITSIILFLLITIPFGGSIKERWIMLYFLVGLSGGCGAMLFGIWSEDIE